VTRNTTIERFFGPLSLTGRVIRNKLLAESRCSLGRPPASKHQMKRAPLTMRLLSIAAIMVILITVYSFVIRPLQLRWGANSEEVERTMPGDDLVAHPTFLATRAITIRGRPEQIWPWIAQMGFDRAGYYGYDLIENLGSKTGIHSEESIVPVLQHPKAGDVLPISTVAHLTFGEIKPDRYLIWQSEVVPHDGAFTWALYPVDETHTRLVSRIRLRYHWASRALALDLFTEFADHVAVPKILMGIRDRVERRTPESLVGEAVEIAVWILALAELVASIVFVFCWRDWRLAWTVAVASGFLLLFALYAHAATWIGATLGCGIAVFIILLRRQASFRSSEV